jgi:hypothetical protein
LRLREFVEHYGEPYSRLLGIDLSSRRTDEVFKWFVASVLYGKPIRESSATNTYKCFEKRKILSPEKILQTGWDGLVSILDEGGYARYDFSTATKLLDIAAKLIEMYGGDLNKLHEAATDSKDLEARIMALGKGVGPTTTSIFLRDMRMIWPKADPEPTPMIQQAQRSLGIRNLKSYAKANDVDLVRLETALLRLAKDFLRKRLPSPVKIGKRRARYHRAERSAA